MILVRDPGEPPLQPGTCRIDVDPLRLRAHLAQHQADLDAAVEGIFEGGQHWGELLPLLRTQRMTVAERIRARLRLDLPPLRAEDLNESLARLGFAEGIDGLAACLASRSSATRRSAAIALNFGSAAEHSVASRREAITGNDTAHQGLIAMLFEADRWNRGIAVELCTALDIELGDALCRQLTAQPADHRGETAAVIEYLALRRKDMGAIDLFERLAELSTSGAGYGPPFRAVTPYLDRGEGAEHDRVLGWLSAFLAANRRPYSGDERWDADGRRFNGQADAVSAVAASPSTEAAAVLWTTAREDPHAHPRVKAWQALMRREGSSACEALLESSETDASKRDAINGVFWDPHPAQVQTLAGIAQSLVERAMPDPVRETLSRLVRRAQRQRGEPDVPGGPREDPVDELDAYDAEAAARQLVRAGAVSPEEAHWAVEKARAHTSASGHVPVLEHCHIFTVFDVESATSPPWYAQALADLSSNCRGEFRADAVRQVWFDQRAGGAPAVGLLQFVGAGALVEFGVHDRGDYYDMPAMLGAANAALEHAGATGRFHPLGCGDQVMGVLHAASPDVAARVGHLIGFPLLADADSAMLSGRLGEAAAWASMEGKAEA